MHTMAGTRERIERFRPAEYFELRMEFLKASDRYPEEKSICQSNSPAHYQPAQKDMEQESPKIKRASRSKQIIQHGIKFYVSTTAGVEFLNFVEKLGNILIVAISRWWRLVHN